MTASLEVYEGHDLHQVADVQGIGGRVKTDISGSYFLLQLSLSAGHHIVNHSPPGEFVDKV